MKDDLISRQAAIDALDTGLWGVEWDKALATAMLKDLPPVTPTISEKETVEDCKEIGKDNLAVSLLERLRAAFLVITLPCIVGLLMR